MKYDITRTVSVESDARLFLEGFVNKETAILEFGSGGSTLWFAEHGGMVYSVEHDQKWHNCVVTKCADMKNTCLIYCNRPYNWVSEFFAKTSIDLIFIDGRDRVECFHSSISLLHRGGVLMLDDTHREKYSEVGECLKEWPRSDAHDGKIRKTSWWIKP